jgi:riboflavin synthase
MAKIGVADTTFSRVNMFSFVVQQLKESNFSGEIERYTVPGVKDLPLACKKLIEEFHCDIVLALGMPGKERIDKTCSHEASTSIQRVQLQTNTHILEVFVHMDEAKNERELLEIAENRTKKHTINALELLKGKTALSSFAGKGRRQGFEDEGEIKFPCKEKTKKIALVVSEYNSEITKKMESIALEHAKKLNLNVVKKVYVPGVFDAPLAVKRLLERKEIQGVVLLGAVIQGETSHDELVAFTCAEKVSELSLRYFKPVALGVSGPGISRENAIKRIESYSRRAVEAVLKMIELEEK